MKSKETYYAGKLDLVSEPNTNPYLKYLLTLYSQSQLTNRGTRGLDPFSDATYVETMLDTVLKPRIFDGELDLVIITGNAGDGKTAFIQKMEEEIRDSCSSFKSMGNGCIVTYNGREIRTNYDGSQDEGTLQSDLVLEEFFAPFKGDHVNLESLTLVRIIAINEGRLVDFLQSNSDKFRWLHARVQESLKGVSSLDRIQIVNLNSRSVVDGMIEKVEAEADSIFDKVLNELCEKKIWSYCDVCDIKNKCYVKFNVDSMNDPNNGRVVQANLKRLFQITHFRRKLHITIRDLRSALSFILFNVSSCEEIHQVVNERNEGEHISRFYYNAAFGGKFEPDSNMGDRLVRLISQLDVARTANPKLDASINFSPPREQFVMTSKYRSDIDISLIDRLYLQRPDDPFDRDEKRVQAADVYHKTMRRKLYFESAFSVSMAMLPYTELSMFAKVMRGEADLDEIRNHMAYALSLSEGIYNETIARQNVCIRAAYRSGSEVKSFYLHDVFSFDFRPIVPTGDSVEYLANSLVFKNRESHLEISLDLFEMMYRIIRGYSPTLDELKGSFLNLLMFKNQLGNLPFDRMLITENDSDFYEVSKTQEMKVAIKKVNP